MDWESSDVVRFGLSLALVICIFSVYNFASVLPCASSSYTYICTPYQVELDSVGSSKSGESSKSSGVRTQSSYTDSTYGSDKRAPIFTDSDSAQSTGSSANR